MDYCADTWFLLKLFKGDAKALSILENVKNTSDRLIISIITYAEFVKNVLHIGIDKDKLNDFLDSMKASENIILVSPDNEIAYEAAKVSLSYSLSLLDAFIASTSRILKCDLLLTSDSDFRPLIKNKYLKVQSW